MATLLSPIEEQVLLPGVEEKCAELRAEGHVLAVASNQGGVAFGYLTEAEAKNLVRDAATQIVTPNWMMCPHHPQGTISEYATDCPNRKPKPGMLRALMNLTHFRPHETIFVGDMESDRQAAEAAGVHFEWASDFFQRPVCPAQPKAPSVN